MGFNWRKYVPTITWKQNPDEDTMVALLVEQDATITGLNMSVGLLAQNLETLKSEAIGMLSAIAMQHGGELRVKQEFFEAIKGDESANLSLKIERENGDMILRLEIQTEDNNAEETNAENERNEHE